MKVIYSKTGSSGNTSVVQNESGETLIIDCGIAFDKVNREVNYSLGNAVACLVTHSHKDHSMYIDKYVNAGIPIYALPNVIDSDTPNRYRKPIEYKKTYTVNGFKFVPLELIHTNSDGTNCPCAGFLIQDTASGEKMLWATDTQYISQRLPPIEYYCVECNYFVEDNWQENVQYVEAIVEKRRANSHMSFETLVKFLKLQDLSKCKEIHALHISASMLPEQRKNISKELRKQLKLKGVKICL